MAFSIFTSTVLRLLKLMSSDFRALTFANVSSVSAVILQFAISSCDKECELMKLRSVGICRANFFYNPRLMIFDNRKYVIGRRYCS